MKLEYVSPERCLSCGAKKFRFENPRRYICLRQTEHAKYVRANWNRRESNLHNTSEQVPDLRDTAHFRGDDENLPE